MTKIKNDDGEWTIHTVDGDELPYSVENISKALNGHNTEEVFCKCIQAKVTDEVCRKLCKHYGVLCQYTEQDDDAPFLNLTIVGSIMHSIQVANKNAILYDRMISIHIGFVNTILECLCEVYEVYPDLDLNRTIINYRGTTSPDGECYENLMSRFADRLGLPCYKTEIIRRRFPWQ